MNNNFETYTGEVVSLRHANTLYRDYGIVQRNNRALSEMDIVQVTLFLNL